MLHLFLEVIAFVSMEWVVETTTVKVKKSVEIYRGKHEKIPSHHVVTYRTWVYINRD